MDWIYPGYTPPLSIIAGLIGLQALYMLCVGPYRDRFRGSRPVPAPKCVLFSAGVLIAFIALATPLDTIGDDYLFTVHMIQHMLLTLGVAPLLLLGMPDWLMRALLRELHLEGFVRWARHPLVAFLTFNLIFSLAHLPSFYELTLANLPLHAAEHLVFVLTAMLTWMPVVSPVPDIAPPYPELGQVMYLFLQTIPASILGVLIFVASAPLYPTYELAPRITALSPIEDQQLGGLLMWVGGGLYYLIATGIVFFIWASREEAANRRPVSVL